MEIAVFTGLGLLLATAAALGGLGLGRYAWPATRRSDAAAVLAQQMEAARRMEECRALRSHVDQLETAHKAASIEAKTAVVEVARLQERENALSEKLTAQAAQRADLQTQLTNEFENIANRILKANASELSESSHRAVAAILEPLRERLHDFQSKIETTYASEAREILSLKEQIKLIVETSHAIGTQADGLAKALRGDSQLLGRWGEIALERILEAAGLTEGREDIAQGRGLGFRKDARGGQKT